MKAYIATNILGTFAFDEKKKILDYRLFPKDPELIAEQLDKVKNEVIEEEKEVINDLRKAGCKEIVWDKKISVKEISCIYEPENLAKQTLQKEFRRLALDLQWVTSQKELNELLTQVNVILTKKKLREPKKDKVIMQAIGVVDELDHILNTLSERLREWYGLHFPEASKAIQSHERFAELIVKYGKKENIDDKKLAKLIEKSAGIQFSDEDLNTVQSYAKSLLNLYKTRETVSKYVEYTSKEVIPNLSAIATPLLAARLLALSGGLEKISKLPSSTIQLLGSEKALFRHLRGKGRAPKYGIIFTHPYVQQAPKELRGKMARLIAAKLTLAARIDYFSKEDRGKELKEDLDKKIKKLAREK